MFIKVKLKFALDEAMKAQRRSRYVILLSLTSMLKGGGWLTSHLTILSPGKRPRTHYIGGWVGPTAGLDG
jgi:hypothetical protein